MNNKLKFSMIICGATMGAGIFPLKASIPTVVPPGFEDIFDTKQNSIVEVIYGDHSIASVAIEFDQQDVLLTAPVTLVEQITAADMPALSFDNATLLKKLSAPLHRVQGQSFSGDNIVASLNESDSSLRLIFPASYFKSDDKTYSRTFITHLAKAGFVHEHNVNFLSDTWSDSLSIASSDTLNITGNSYFKGIWSYSKDIDLNIEELAFYVESQSTRVKAGRQRFNDNLTSSTPSMAYSFFNSISFDGASIGYMTDNYLNSGSGAASPVTVYLPQSGTVEVYRNGRLIDLQQFPAGLQYLDTSSWPSGGYNVELVSKLVNGSQERKIQPFYKRNGLFRSGDIEYLLQVGRYDQRQGKISSRVYKDYCRNCGRNPWDQDISNNHFAHGVLGYTTESALSFGGGALIDEDRFYTTASMDLPINSWVAERLYIDGIYGKDGSRGYQAGVSKNYDRLGLNVSYRNNRFSGHENDFRRFGIVPSYDYNYLQFSANTFLPWGLGLGINYGLNNLYQDYGRKNKNKFETWDVNLSRDFSILENMNLRVDLGYHRGINAYVNRETTSISSEDRIFAQFTLGMRERSYNHYQSLYLRSRLSDNGNDNNIYSADYSMNLDNPGFDRGGKYAFTGSLNHGPHSENNGGAGLTINNRLGYSSAGFSQSFGQNNYKQYYLSQRGGFVVGDGGIAFGQGDSSSALIVDASELPNSDYFETRNQNGQSIVIKGGQKAALAITPYQKVAPKTEQVFTGQTDAFYNLSAQAPSTWAMPGQVYRIKLSATRNQTATGRLYANGQPLAHARVVGGNAVSDEEGLFVGDFTLKTNELLTSLTVKKESQNYVCPLLEQNVRMTQGIMQIREVNCEVQ